MGKNKLAKFEEIKTFDNVIQIPSYSLDKEDFHLKGKWAESYFKNGNPVVLEIGCGKGEYTLALAERNPHKNYIGVDIKGARIWRGAKTALGRGMKNVVFVRFNVEIINHVFGVSEIEEIWITFPDPQMKKIKKRLTSASFMKQYRDILIKGGVVNLKTDSDFQYLYTLNLARLNGFEIVAETDNIYGSDSVNEALQIKTYYEKQWLSRGIPIKYIAFRFNNTDLKEPEIFLKRDDYRSFGRSARS
ncbi:MAG: tRNA (guanosine(46)-N7)-methyltransferase TrmB [Prolixibacteraceae bacterium]|nr:tRNA (guanosine(46)-N7)-methyltransferase TrmB [Prolixibacteraceae bacterium]